MDLDNLVKEISETSQPKYWRFIAEKDGDCCEKCQRFDGKIFSDDDPAKPKIPLHPNCRCSFEKATVNESKNAMEIVTPENLPSFCKKLRKS